MKVLMYTRGFAPSTGGVETYMTLLAEGLSQVSARNGDRVDVTVATQTAADGMDDGRMPYRIVRRPNRMQLAKLVHAADVVHAAGPAFPPLVMAWLLRKPVVVEHSGYQSICPNGMLLYGPDRALCPGHFMAHRYRECLRCNLNDWGRSRSFRNLVLTFPRRWFCRRATYNIGPSRHIANRIGLPRTEVIFHGVPSDCRDVQARPKNGNGRPLCFAYVGRLIVEKGVAVLLRAAMQLVRDGFDFRIQIYGDGPERERLENLAQQLELGSIVEFAGSVPRENVTEALRNTVAVVMPSVCEDVAPLVALEQMMKAKLVIASDIGGLGEEIGDAGLKFPAGDARKLAACMKSVIMRPEIARTMGSAARERALSYFTATRMVQAHVSLYKKAMQC